MVEKISPKQLLEWGAFFKLDAEELDAEMKKRELEREVSMGVQQMRNKRSRR